MSEDSVIFTAQPKLGIRADVHEIIMSVRHFKGQSTTDFTYYPANMKPGTELRVRFLGGKGIEIYTGNTPIEGDES